MKKIFVVCLCDTTRNLYGDLAAFSSEEVAKEYAKSCADKREKDLRTQFQDRLGDGRVVIQRVENNILVKMNLTNSCIFRSNYYVNELALDDMSWKPAAESQKSTKSNKLNKPNKSNKQILEKKADVNDRPGIEYDEDTEDWRYN